MPFKPATQVKCPKCQKSVYAAEERAVGDLKFHKECYKCSMCNKMLDSTNVNCHETVLYCKMCHGRKFGPKGYGFGGGAAGLSMDTGAHLDYGRDDKVIEYKPPKAAAGEGCPRCGGKVFAAEEMLAKGKVYHRTCFNCKTCRKPLDSVNHCDGPDKEVYCKACYGKAFGPKGYGFGQGMGTLTSDPDANAMIRPHGEADFYAKAAEGEEACPRCGGKVYSAEMMLAKGRPFHKKCFKCKNCKRPLDSMVHCDGPDGEVYCKLCYAKKYGPKGYGFAAGSGGVLTAENIPGGEEDQRINPASAALDVTLIQATPGEGCPRCGGKVFMAEEMFARGRSWHKSCYSCCHCHRPLDSVVGCDAPDGEVYCKLCYAKKYGPKGYGFASGGGGVLSAENIGATDDGLQKKVAFASIDVAKIQAAEGTGCPRCGGKVFMAEEIHARARSWHKHCYTCCHCKRPLDSVVGCDAPDGEVYCKLCYAKKYGPKGYGFASGCGGVLTAENIPGGIVDFEVNPASVAIDTTAILAKPGEGCPRCGGKVFSAEEMLSRYNKWHKRCYNCCDCHRPLDSMVQCDGPDGEIYCKLCYAKKYGPKGYGFASGAGGVLFPESLTMNSEDQSYMILNPPSYATLDVKTLAPAKEGQSRCPRCGGAVFQAEAMVARNKEWHKQCYNCVECHRPLDSMIGCDAPDGEIYCKLCYAKRHGPKGYGYGHTAALVSLGTEDGTPCPSDIRQFGFGTGKARREGSVDQVDHENKSTYQQKVIINQIRNLPVAGRVPRGTQDQVDGLDYEEVYRAPSIDSDEEEVPTSDFTTQTSPRPPIDLQSPPVLAQEEPDSNEPSESESNQDLYLPPDPSNISSQMHDQMSAMQKEMQQQMQQKLQQHLQHVSLNEETSAEAEVSIQAQHSAQISQEQIVTMKMEHRVEEVSSHSEFLSSQMTASSHSESGVEASGEFEVALDNGSQSQTNIESILPEEEEEEE